MLKKLKVLLVSAALVGGVAGIAAAQGGRGGGGLDHQARKAEMLQKFDANNDGKLDRAERQAMHEQRAAMMFAKLDKNGDGVLSLDEFKSGKHGKFGRMGRGRFRGHHGDRDGGGDEQP